MLSAGVTSNLKKFKCFVAMAFDHDDTDKMYDKAIVPILKKLHVKPVRIDRVEHNDDIDDRIIKEIKECDFMIADLTYARPSVYFEAGFAQRIVPVIYSCRKDHFMPIPDDKYGNFRIHFDLQMKNIITWKPSQENLFRKRIEKRVNKVIRPLLANKQKLAIEKQEESDFLKNSIISQEEILRNLVEKKIKQRGFQKLGNNLFYSPKHRQIKTLTFRYSTSFTSHNVKNILIDYLKDLNEIHEVQETFFEYKNPLEIDFSRRVMKLSQDHIYHLILCTSRRLSINALAGGLKNFRIQTENELVGVTSFSPKVFNRNSIVVEYHIIIIDNVKSERVFLEKFSQIIPKL